MVKILSTNKQQSKLRVKIEISSNCFFVSVYIIYQLTPGTIILIYSIFSPLSCKRAGSGVSSKKIPIRLLPAANPDPGNQNWNLHHHWWQLF